MTQAQSQNNDGTGSNVPQRISAVGGEFVGSFFIFVAIYLVSALSPALYGPSIFLIAIATGLAYAVMTVIFGKLSGGQFNPAVTIAAMLTYKTKVIDGLCYIVAQVLGGIAAGGVVKLIIPTSETATAKMWFANAVNGFGKGSLSATQLANAKVSFGLILALVVEVIAVAIIVAVAMRTLDENGKTTSSSAVAMGAAYALGVTFTYPITGASLNPARSTGIALFTMKSGLAVNPITQLLFFWVSGILASALVSLVLIIARILSDRIDEKANEQVAGVADFGANEVPFNAQAQFDAAVNVAESNDLAGNDAGQTSFEMPSLDMGSVPEPGEDPSAK